jgi:hypothetical protein
MASWVTPTPSLRQISSILGLTASKGSCLNLNLVHLDCRAGMTLDTKLEMRQNLTVLQLFSMTVCVNPFCTSTEGELGGRSHHICLIQNHQLERFVPELLHSYCVLVSAIEPANTLICSLTTSMPRSSLALSSSTNLLY